MGKTMSIQEWLDDMEAVSGVEEGMTVREMAKAKNKSIDWVREKLKEADDMGILVVKKTTRLNVAKIKTTTYLYSFKKKGGKK